MHEDWVPILSLIFSIVAIVLVFISTGISLTLKFRESEATTTKKREIKSRLKKELESSVIEFLEKHREKKEIDDKMMKEITELGKKVKGTSLGDILLENMIYFGNEFLKTLIGGVFLIAFMIGYILMGWEIFDVFSIILFIILTVFSSGFLFYQEYKNIRDYYYLREDFQKLYENPTFESCENIAKDLDEKKVRRIKSTI